MIRNPHKLKRGMEVILCPLCKAQRYQVLSTKGNLGLPLSVAQCDSCGLVYLNPRWKKEKYYDFYLRHYDTYYRPCLFPEEEEKYKRIREITYRLESHGLMPNAKKILDIGSGMGWNLSYLKKHHYPKAELAAIEPSPRCQTHLTKSSIKVVASDIYEPWKDGTFDLIIMRHVLEHLTDINDALKKVRKALSPEGLLYIAVPNSLHPNLPVTLNHFRVVHTFYFTQYTLGAFLERAGLTPVCLIAGDSINPHELYAVCKRTRPKKIVYDKKPGIQHASILLKYIHREQSLLIQWRYKAFRFLLKSIPLLKRSGLYEPTRKIYRWLKWD